MRSPTAAHVRCGVANPKNVLRRGAEIIDSARLMRGKGIDDADLLINWADLMKHKHGFTDPAPQSMKDGLTSNGVTTSTAPPGSPVPASSINGAPYDADRFLVATGARARPWTSRVADHPQSTSNPAVWAAEPDGSVTTGERRAEQAALCGSRGPTAPCPDYLGPREGRDRLAVAG